MNTQKNENLKALFETLVGPREAEQAADDIRRADRILSEHPAPGPSEELLAQIKTQVRSTIERTGRSIFGPLLPKIAAVAAVLLVGAVISLRLFEKEPAPVPPTTIPWEVDNLVAQDADLAAFSAEIEQIESDLLALQLGENGSNGHLDLTELEIELMEISGDFWKG
ncbi:MAG TPA: hypothetical protein VMX13_03495 [Sedimentisphaerales bacterium]|nr:hypothetical protein [Sedimentisphaerales bacterium]